MKKFMSGKKKRNTFDANAQEEHSIENHERQLL
jgi:hypothetical protein